MASSIYCYSMKNYYCCCLAKLLPEATQLLTTIESCHCFVVVVVVVWRRQVDDDDDDSSFVVVADAAAAAAADADADAVNCLASSPSLSSFAHKLAACAWAGDIERPTTADTDDSSRTGAAVVVDRRRAHLFAYGLLPRKVKSEADMAAWPLGVALGIGRPNSFDFDLDLDSCSRFFDSIALLLLLLLLLNYFVVVAVVVLIGCHR